MMEGVPEGHVLYRCPDCGRLYAIPQGVHDLGVSPYCLNPDCDTHIVEVKDAEHQVDP